MYSFKIRNKRESEFCLDGNNQNSDLIIGYRCHNLGGPQVRRSKDEIWFLILRNYYTLLFLKFWAMSKEKQIRRDMLCIEYEHYEHSENSIRKKGKILISECDGNGGIQEWYYENGLIRHSSGFCIQMDPNDIL